MMIWHMVREAPTQKMNHRLSNSYIVDFNDLQELSYIDQAVLLSPLHWEHPLSVLGDQYDLKHRDDGIVFLTRAIFWLVVTDHWTGNETTHR